jgi:hypothetical protein
MKPFKIGGLKSVPGPYPSLGANTESGSFLMPGPCKHGLDESACAACQQARETEPLRRDALRVTEEGKPTLILRTILSSLNMTALVLEGTTIRIETIKEISLRHPMTVPSFKPRKILKEFLDLALQKGYLFQPKPESTYQGQAGEGPPRCPFDHPELSSEKGLFGCTQCGATVCQCGRCPCSYTGDCHQGQFIRCPPLSVSREERLEYMRVVRFCLANIEPRPTAKILLFTRDIKRRALKK